MISTEFPRPTVGVVDTGTNTIKFSLATFTDALVFNILQSRAETVRLGFEIEKTGVVDERRIQRAIACLGEFREISIANGATELIGVATEAFRSTLNGEQVLSRIREQAGWNVRMISGVEEARLTFKGLRAVMRPHGNSLLVDIGGGSTEFVVAVNRIFHSSASIPIGSGRLAHRLFMNDPPGLEAVHQARASAFNELVTLDIGDPAQGAMLCLVGGNGLFLKALSSHFNRGSELTPARLPDLCDAIATCPSLRLATTLGIQIERARVLPAGAGMSLAIVDKFRPLRITATESGINTGLLLERFDLD